MPVYDWLDYINGGLGVVLILLGLCGCCALISMSVSMWRCK